jgi:MFS family permease
MVDAVANSFLIVVLPLYIASGDVSKAPLGLSNAAATGVVLASFGIFSALVQPFAGRLSDRVGRRRVFVLSGLLVLAGLNLLYPMAGGFGSILAIRLGQGMAAALTIVASVALVNELSEARSRGTNMGVFNGLRLLGFGAGPLGAGFVVSSGPYTVGPLTVSGFDASFALAALGALGGAVLVGLLVEDPPRRVSAVLPPAPKARSGLDPVLTLGLATFTMALCIALLAAIEPEVNHRLGQDARWFGVQFAAFIFSVALTQPFVGRASDRVGRKVFVLAGLVLLAPTTVVQGLVQTPWQMLGARIAQGLSGAMVFAPALALAGDLARAGESGARLAVLTMAFGLGLAGGQLASGFLVGLGFVVPFAGGAVLSLAAALLVWRQVEEPGGE